MGKIVASVAALSLAIAGSCATAGSATAHAKDRADGATSTKVLVRGNGSTVALSRSVIREGRIAFKVSTTNPVPGAGSQILMFKLVGNATLATFKANLAKQFSPDPLTAAQSTRNLKRDARFFGLADVVRGTPATVTERLKAGQYYLMDLASGPVPNPSFTSLKVRRSHGDNGGGGSDDRLASSSSRPEVRLTSANRFDGPGTLPARGTVRVKNVSDTIHFMVIAPVKKGTTDRQIQAFFEEVPGTADPFLADAPSVGLSVLSPGQRADLTYKLPVGTYVLLCFIADERDGMPHALMGMHKVVKLK